MPFTKYHIRTKRMWHPEEVGFTYALISDHYHPWVDAQGHSPFVWSVIGGIATATKHLRLGTGVTCPTIRIHQVGPDQEGFIRFAEREILPRYAAARSRAA